MDLQQAFEHSLSQANFDCVQYLKGLDLPTLLALIFVGSSLLLVALKIIRTMVKLLIFLIYLIFMASLSLILLYTLNLWSDGLSLKAPPL
ncbi:hypothetical protein DSO57_1014474 [Entomophthora muscae]|uniref:Uncharacterized protein n=1 Tax=Entomophthora muscae TaxID=34485 RepID=A0ACC2TSQ8_9FUNG|nr:hypothetical protein DSO57_1014474 [Entomophthora muscae]